MKLDKNLAVNSLLREQILDCALQHNDRKTFERMSSENWEHYLNKYHIKDIRSAEKDDFNDKADFLFEDFFEDFNENTLDLEEYIEETTLTDVFSEKKKTLYQLMVLTRATNEKSFNLINSIYNDNELIHLLTIITDKTYRNGVFYMDEDEGSLKVKDSRYNQLHSLSEYLEVYRRTQETFYLEIKFIKVKNAGLV